MIKAWIPAADAYIAAATEKGLKPEDPELAELDRAAKQTNKVLDDQLTVVSKLKEANGATAAEESAALFKHVSLLMGALTVISAICGVIIGTLITRGITRSLGGEPVDVAVVANAVATGDLTTAIDTSRAAPGSVVAAMDHMQQSLRQVVGQVRASSDSIATGSAQIATGNADLSQRTEEQASNLQQTAASMEQLTATVRNNADTAAQASQLAGSAARRGRAAAAPSWARSSRTMEDITAQPQEDRRHHRRDRRHRVPDQHPGAERRGRSGARRRAGPRLRGRGRRGAHAGAALAPRPPRRSRA